MSIKKLQDLLNTGSQTGREFNLQNSRAPSLGQSQFSPLGTNFGATPNRSPSYTAIPGVHNMFYNPASKPQQETVCPSPMFQIPTKKTLPPINSIFQGSRFTAAETNQSNNQTSFESNSLSNSLNSLLNQLQTNVSSQPRNLEELLQRSFNSMPSNSQFQSPFVSSTTKSPFMNGYNNNNHNHNQPSMASDLSKILNPMTLLETSLQNNNFRSNNTNQNGMNQNNEAINKTLVLQLAQILKQESESKIKSAIAELILKYRALGLLNNLSGNEMLDLQNLINGTEPAQSNNFQFQPNHQEVLPQLTQQATVPLSSGLTMNAVRNDLQQPMPQNMQSLFKNNLQPTRIDATRRELFAMSEPPAYQSNDHFQSNMMQGSLFQSNQAQMSNMPLSHLPISPVNALDQEMNSLTLQPGNMTSNQFSHFGMPSFLSAPEKMEDLAVEDLSSMLKLQVPSDEELPGVYNKQERIGKILKYKNKIRKWRAEHPVKKSFKGRSAVANQKPRIKGKFVTQEEYTHHLSYDCKKEFMNTIKEEGF